MARTIDNVTAWPLRTRPKDIGVGVVVLVALALGLLLRLQVEGRRETFQSTDPSFTISYPAAWRANDDVDGAILSIENPQSGSPYKANVTVETRELDPAGPPTLQELVDRRVAQHSDLKGYHFLSNSNETIGDARAAQIEYAYTVLPIDMPRSASLPVVVRCREYIIVAEDRTYYITLAAAESDFAGASEQFDRMVQTARVQ
jgi:hypothetical protein